jgi:hypothetical protein
MSENVMVDVNAEMDALRRELDELRHKYEKLKNNEHWMRDEMSYNKGMIEGLKFAIRCNGVSGAEVKKVENYCD